VDSKSKKEVEVSQAAETGETRRDVASKLGRFAAYAAPFTILALSAKAGTGSGPGPHVPRP